MIYYVRNTHPSKVPEFTAAALTRTDDDGCFETNGTDQGRTMQEVARQRIRSNRFDQIDPDVQLKRVLDSLENENALLKNLVIRLSETIIRSVTVKR
jgi:hypothetical protein